MQTQRRVTQHFLCPPTPALFKLLFGIFIFLFIHIFIFSIFILNELLALWGELNLSPLRFPRLYILFFAGLPLATTGLTSVGMPLPNLDYHLATFNLFFNVHLVFFNLSGH